MSDGVERGEINASVVKATLVRKHHRRSTEKKKIYVGGTGLSVVLSPSSLEVPRVIQNNRVTLFEILRTYVRRGFADRFTSNFDQDSYVRFLTLSRLSLIRSSLGNDV